MYQPPDTVLRKLADLLINFALGSGKGVKPRDVIQLTVPDVAKPLYIHLLQSVLKAGAFPKVTLLPTGTEKLFFDLANDEQLTFFPAAFKKAEADLIDHHVSIIAEVNPKELSFVDPRKLFRTMDARRQMREWLNAKEQQGKFTWTLALWGTEAMAKEAGMTLKQYWHEIIVGCYLDAANPVQEWQRIQKEQGRLKRVLDAMKIRSVHVESERIDLTVGIGSNRKWLGGGGRNIPSFEIFVSPDWRMTEGTIAFNQPLYRYGNILKEVSLEFRKGKVIRATARKGQKVLDAMLERKNADKIGEFSLTDRRFSRITKFMANTLFDENIGGRFGNTHIALGRAYRDSFIGDMSQPTEVEWETMGYNESPEHTDIISTEDRTVTATMEDGKTKIIFKDGQFTV
ncbi:MAG: aminopeptidase [Candidatus Peribacteraceae bacterium]|nr:aminopeptidase [Candidatus Peribacteraceae bacterium]